MDSYKNKLERIRKTLSCTEPDRIPVFELFWVRFLENWRREKKLGADADIYKYYDMDLAFVVPKTDPKLDSFTILEKTEDYIIFRSGYGCTIKKVYDAPMPQFLDFSIKSADQYEKFELDDPLDNSRYYDDFFSITANTGDTITESFDKQIRKYKGIIPICGAVCEGHEKIWRIRGSEGVWVDLVTEKDKIKKFLKRLEEFETKIGLKQIAMGCECMFIAGDVAYDKGLFFSPAIWREFFKPILKNMCTTFKKSDPDTRIIYHGCGNATEIFDDLIECGIDAYHSLEVKAGIDVIDLKKKYKNRLAYIGNIDCRDVLPGSKEGIKKNLLRKLNAAKGGGYIPSADHSVPYNVSVENYDYFVSLIRQYGKYPLDLGEYDINIE